MDLLENIREALKSIRSNMLRSSLTAAIIAIGLLSLVGILTAIDAIKSTVSSGFSELGANSFDIQDLDGRRTFGGRRVGGTKRNMSYREVNEFKERFASQFQVSISGFVSGDVEVKYASKKTNPNSALFGVDQYYVENKALKLAKGRNFSPLELQSGANAVIIGHEIARLIFDNIDPIGKVVGFMDRKFVVIGVIDKSGGLGGGRSDRSLYIPIENAYRLSSSDTEISFTITASLSDPAKMDMAMSEATGVMRLIRKDRLGEASSFEISRSESLASSLDEISGTLKLGGAVIGLITLMGASIGLMNIMMVSVTERTREIGVRKALGATPSRIRQQFLIESIMICIIGGLVGILMGMLVGNLVAKFFGDGAFLVPWLWIVLGLAVCIVVGVMSGYYPASKASKLDPIESLRYE
jgi:putative ABC transport system permease protein